MVWAAGELGALGQGDVGVGALVLQREDTGRLLHLVGEDLVLLGAAGDQEVAVREVGVPAAEQVLRGVDVLGLAGDRVPEHRLEGPRVEVLLAVARAGDQQHVTGVEQRGVDGARPEALGQLDGVPLAVGLHVRRAGVPVVGVGGLGGLGQDGPVGHAHHGQADDHEGVVADSASQGRPAQGGAHRLLLSV
jgi:hypothetical protein